MKRSIILLAVIFAAQVSFAQAPQKMSYQAVVRGSDSKLITSSQVGMRISILQGSSSGTAVYVETHTPTANNNGLVTVEIGAGTVTAGNFTEIDWTSGIYFIKTETDPAGGVNYTITGTSQLLSVPYSLLADRADIARVAESITGTIPDSNLSENLQDLADGSLTGSKVGAGINAVNISGSLSTTVIPNLDAGKITTGSFSDARLSTHLQDLGDGSLTGTKVGSGISATNVTTGTLPLNVVPDLDAAKITTGSISDSRLSTHLQDLGDGSLTGSKVGTGISATNVTTGTLPLSVVPDLDAAKITTGSISDSRLSTHLQDLGDGSLTGSKVGTGINATNVTTGTLPLSVVPDLDAAKITTGTVTDSRLSTHLQDLADGTLTGSKVDGTTITGLSASNVTTGTLNVARGGTGAGTLSGIILGNGTSSLTAVAHTGANQYLRRNSGNTAYEFGALSGVASSGNYDDLSNKPTIISNSFSVTATGYQALYSNTTGVNNTASGYKALYSNNTGQNNTAIGSLALYSNHYGSYNTANGYMTLYSNTSGDNNTASGWMALYYNTVGDNNTANGWMALYSNVSGNDNTVNGRGALYSNTTGYNNTATGHHALYSNTTGSYNTANGWASLVYSTGNANTAIGQEALYSNTTGSNNTALGSSAGSTVKTGSNLTLLGNNAEPTSASVSNQITLGNNAVSSLRCNVQTITSLSDARDKKNIQDLSLGLDFIMKIKPRQFNWDKREWYESNQSDGSKMQVEPTSGFIAQELDDIQTTAHAEWLNLVLKDNPEKWEATYGNLLPVLVKAIQELQLSIQAQDQLIKELQMENATLKSNAGNNKKLEQRLSSLETLLEKKVQKVTVESAAKMIADK